MKKQLFGFTLVVTLIISGLLSSCGGTKKLTPEEEMKNYGQYFIEKLTKGEIDSLKQTYPGIVHADSLITIETDSVTVTPYATGNEYEIVLMPKVSLKAKRSEDGVISVEESYGLFAYPSEKFALAKKTGMWKATLNDVENSKRMSDEGFFKYIEDQVKKKTTNLISYRAVWDEGELEYYVLTNNTPYYISGNDYTIKTKLVNWDDKVVDRSSRSGVDIGPNNTANIDMPESFFDYPWEIDKIVMNLSAEDIVERFAPLYGNEYQEYLDSKR